MKLFAFLFVFLFCHSASGQLQWADLNFQQQKLLLAFQDQWQTLEPSIKKSLIENTNDWINKSQEEKAQAYLKLKKFKQLPKEEQERLKRRAQHFKNMTPAERRSIKQAKRYFDTLSPQERKRLKHKYQQLPPKHRKKAVKKFVNKQRFHRFLSQFDVSVRKDIVHMLESLPQNSRRIFRNRIKSVSSNEKREVTLALLKLSAQERIQFISHMPN